MQSKTWQNLRFAATKWKTKYNLRQLRHSLYIQRTQESIKIHLDTRFRGYDDTCKRHFSV